MPTEQGPLEHRVAFVKSPQEYSTASLRWPQEEPSASWSAPAWENKIEWHTTVCSALRLQKSAQGIGCPLLAQDGGGLTHNQNGHTTAQCVSQLIKLSNFFRAATGLPWTPSCNQGGGLLH